MFCPECGANINPDYKFCHMCGALLNKADSVENSSTTPQPPVTEPVIENDICPPETPIKQQPNLNNQQTNNIPPDYHPINTNSFYFPNASYPPQRNPLIDPGKNFSIASLVLGIVAIPFSCLLVFGWPVTFVCSIVGLVLGILARDKSKKVGLNNGVALAGIITSSTAIGLLVCICLMFLFLFLTGNVETTINGETISELI